MTMVKMRVFRDFCMAHPNWVIVVATLLVFLPAFPLKFWLIDDHEIVSFLNTLHADGLAGFWHQWLQLGDFGTMSRFRPIYYLLRAIEILLWRDNLFLWVAVRCTIAFVFAASIFRLANKILPPLIALLFSLSTLCVPWLSDTLFRLGPAESYAILFTALLIFSLFPKSGQVAWLAVAAYIAMLVGIKENFTVLIPLGIWAALTLLRERKIFAAVLASIFVVLSLSCVAILAYKLHLSSGVDIYNQSTGTARFSGMVSSLFFSKMGWFSLAVILACLYTVLSNKDVVSRKNGMVVFLGCSAILTFNLYFYAGIPVYHIRYAFPYWPILLGMLTVICISIAATNPMRRLFLDKYMVRYFGLAIICIGLVILMARNALLAHQYAEATIRTDTAMSQILQRAKTVDEVVVRVAGSKDYEPVFSIVRFMKFSQLSKPLFLSVENIKGGANFAAPDFSEKLIQELKKVELNGGFGGYEPAHNRSSNKQHCLEVVFHASASSVCSERVLVLY